MNWLKQKVPHIITTLVYALFLSWLYVNAVSARWGYMGFKSEYTAQSLVLILLVSLILALFLPDKPDTRGLVLTVIHHWFSIPSVVYYFFSDASWLYFLSFVIFIVCINFFSKIRIPTIIGPQIKIQHFLYLNLVLILTSLLAYVAFGGLSYFSLSLSAVYEFRRIAAASVPGVMGYVFSNVSNVVIPISLLLCFTLRRYTTIAFIVVLAIILFGMTHHKSVFFTPFLIIGFYYAFQRIKKLSTMGWVFLTLPLIALVQVIVIRELYGFDAISQITNLFIRRLLFVPPMLDSFYVEYFTENPLYYWSSTKFGLGIAEQPYERTAAFVIGTEFFGDDDMSANTGAIGSGFANAALFGVIIYSSLIGLMISMFHAYGHRLGHAFVSSVCLMSILNVVRSADLTTAVLTHGLFLLFILLILLPTLWKRDSRSESTEAKEQQVV